MTRPMTCSLCRGPMGASPYTRRCVACAVKERKRMRKYHRRLNGTRVRRWAVTKTGRPPLARRGA